MKIEPSAQQLVSKCLSGDLKALSIQQPWCHRILYGGKDIENRSWNTKFRGWVLIHASLGVAKDMIPYVTPEMPKGGFVGLMHISDCVTTSDSPWFHGPRGFVISDAFPIPFVPCKGAQSFFKPPPDVLSVLAAAVLSGVASRG